MICKDCNIEFDNKYFTDKERCAKCGSDFALKSVIENGATVICPNGLPICSYNSYVAMENGHADHPNYIKPITVHVIGDDVEEYEKIEDHAIIFADIHLIVTLYEGCYEFFSATNGRKFKPIHERKRKDKTSIYLQIDKTELRSLYEYNFIKKLIHHIKIYCKNVNENDLVEDVSKSFIMFNKKPMPVNVTDLTKKAVKLYLEQKNVSP